MSVPVSPKFPTIIKDLVDKSKRVPDIDLSNVGGGGYPIKHVTLNGNSLMLPENTYLIIDNPLNNVNFLINPFANTKTVICDVVTHHPILSNTGLMFGSSLLRKDVIVTIDGVETTMKYEIPPFFMEESMYFNEELEEPIKHVYVGDEYSVEYDGEYNFVLKESNDILILDLGGVLELLIGTSFKLIKDGDVYKGFIPLGDENITIVSTKPIIEFGDVVTATINKTVIPTQIFYYKKPDLTKVNEYIVEFSADSVAISDELVFNNNTPPAVSKSGRTVLSIVNGICAYLNIE